ncbi:unnamed protein product [Pedinophyceae sp. YPF-701]|nr:unnamed protein product [Pedinophyceae sp. YPF-701]
MAGASAEAMSSMEPCAFERLLGAVPAVLEALPEASLRAVAATSWTALVAALRHAPLRIDADETMLNLILKMERGRLPAVGTITCKRGMYPHVAVVADDAAVMVRQMGRARRTVEDMVADHEREGWPLRVRCLRGRWCDLVQTAGEPARCYHVEHDAELRWWLRTVESEHGAAYAAALRRTLERATVREHVEEVSLWECPMRGAQVATLAPALAGLGRLRCLRLWKHTLLDDEGLAALAGVVRGQGGLRELAVYKSGGDMLPLIDSVGEHPALEVLEVVVSDHREAEGAALGAVAGRSRALRRLAVGQGEGQMVWWEETGFAQALVSALGEVLGANAHLRELNLSTAFLYDFPLADFMAGLGKNTTLEVLDLSQTELDDEGFEELASALSGQCAVRELSLRGVGPGEAIASALRERSCLTRLDCQDAEVDSDFIRQLAQALESGALGRTLEVLNLSRTEEVQPEDYAALADALARNGECALRELTLRVCLFQHDMWTALGRVLSNNGALQVLDLSDSTSHYMPDSEDAVALAAGLKNNTTLRRLAVARGHIGRRGAKALADALGETSALEELDLNYQLDFSELTLNGVDGQLAWFLQEQRELFDESTAAAFAAAVDRGAALRRLDLRGDVMGARGVGAVLDAMARREPSVSRVLLASSPANDSGIWLREARQGLYGRAQHVHLKVEVETEGAQARSALRLWAGSGSVQHVELS